MLARYWTQTINGSAGYLLSGKLMMLMLRSPLKCSKELSKVTKNNQQSSRSKIITHHLNLFGGKQKWHLGRFRDTKILIGIAFFDADQEV